MTLAQPNTPIAASAALDQPPKQPLYPPPQAQTHTHAHSILTRTILRVQTHSPTLEGLHHILSLPPERLVCHPVPRHRVNMQPLQLAVAAAGNQHAAAATNTTTTTSNTTTSNTNTPWLSTSRAVVVQESSAWVHERQQTSLGCAGLSGTASGSVAAAALLHGTLGTCGCCCSCDRVDSLQLHFTGTAAATTSGCSVSRGCVWPCWGAPAATAEEAWRWQRGCRRRALGAAVDPSNTTTSRLWATATPHKAGCRQRRRRGRRLEAPTMC